jgi:hemolysin activation/secretion protein
MRRRIALVVCMFLLSSGAGTGWGQDPPGTGLSSGKATVQQKRGTKKKSLESAAPSKRPAKSPAPAPDPPASRPSTQYPAAAKPEAQYPSADRPEAQSGSQPPAPPPAPPTEGGEFVFVVKDYVVEGSRLLPPEKIKTILEPFTGERIKASDIEKARVALEKAYQGLGYPTVIVVTPEQTIESGSVRLQVIETKLSSVTVTGNRWFSTEHILRKLPSLRPGYLIYEPTVLKELETVNANPDRQVTPVMKPGKELGTLELELKTTDRLPLHAKFSSDNRGPFTTPAKRFLAEVQYTNLWDRDHILTLQTSQTPDDWGAVQTYGFTYAAPLATPSNLFVAYFSKAISTSTLGGATLPVSPGDIAAAGNATIAGIRYYHPLDLGGTMAHSLAFGADFKRLESTDATFPGSLGTLTVLSPIQYTPLSIGYSGSSSSDKGHTKVGLTVLGYVAGMIPGGTEDDFKASTTDLNDPGQGRSGTTGTFAVVKTSFERLHNLPEGYAMQIAVDGQYASQQLIPAEQYFAGGLDTVRGYIQYEAIADHAVRGRLELLAPAWSWTPFDRPYDPRASVTSRFVAFYDAASLWIIDPSPGQIGNFQMHGVGVGVRAKFQDLLTFQLDQAWALSQATQTRPGDTFVHFSVSMAF